MKANIGRIKGLPAARSTIPHSFGVSGGDMPNAAIRIDPISGVEERLEHVRTERGLLYTWCAIPPHSSKCVLVCSSVFGDFTANYSRERAIGLALASKGVAAMRFHYAGEGNSYGDRGGMTFSSLCDDAAAVLDHARRAGFSEFALLGTRLGALVAAATAAPIPGLPLCLWEPVEDPRQFLKDAFRAKRISQTAQAGHAPVGDWRQELEQNGRLDLLGYDVHPPLLDSLAEINLLTALGTLPRPVFVGRFGAPGKRDDLRHRLAERGFTVEAASYALSESWWFQSELPGEHDDLITASADWLTRALEP